MTKQERQGWIIVASLFTTLFLIFGSGFNTFGVFLPALLTEFGWSRAQGSTLQAALALSAGLCAPLVGLLLDRFEARRVIVGGALLAALSFLVASRAHSFAPMLVAYLVLGLGVGGATLLPCSLVVANWFDKRRGIAMGVTFAGTSTGGMVMTIILGLVIARSGWRLGYVTLAVPMLLIVIPLVLLTVRTRPEGRAGTEQTVAGAASGLPGLEVREAVRSRSFWLFSLALFCFAFAAAGAGAHLIIYLIGIGYGEETAALIMGLVFGLTSVGKLVMGVFADRVSGRIALSVNFMLTAAGVILLMGASNVVVLVGFVIVYGLTLGAPLVLAPMVLVDSLGLKRFGTIQGLSAILNTAGAAVGPIVAGRIFDLTQSYQGAFVVFLAALVVGGAATFGCRPLKVEQESLERVPASA